MSELFDEKCKDCKCGSTDICWSKQNRFYEQWKLDNPNSEYLGWVSI
jgi:hypothetical protein